MRFITFVLCALAGCSSPAKSIGAVAIDLGVACDHTYAATYLRCGGPTLPASEIARVRLRYDEACRNQALLPGSGATAEALEACATALDAMACQAPYLLPLACNFRGTRAGGDACSDGVQCKSGQCKETQALTPGGPIGPITCSTCTDATDEGDVGDACKDRGCRPGTICTIEDPPPPMPTYTCKKIVAGARGDHCDLQAFLCADGLYCAMQTNTCQPNGDVGATCGEGSHLPGGCRPPLACDTTTFTCMSRTEGASCHYDVECPPGLGCVGTGSCSGNAACATRTCEPIVWVGPDEPCNDSTRCLVGYCTGSAPAGSEFVGKCQTVIADGEPCNASQVGPSAPQKACDTFSICFQQTCSIGNSVVCK